MQWKDHMRELEKLRDSTRPAHLRTVSSSESSRKYARGGTVLKYPNGGPVLGKRSFNQNEDNNSYQPPLQRRRIENTNNYDDTSSESGTEFDNLSPNTPFNNWPERVKKSVFRKKYGDLYGQKTPSSDFLHDFNKWKKNLENPPLIPNPKVFKYIAGTNHIGLYSPDELKNDAFKDTSDATRRMGSQDVTAHTKIGLSRPRLKELRRFLRNPVVQGKLGRNENVNFNLNNPQRGDARAVTLNQHGQTQDLNPLKKIIFSRGSAERRYNNRYIKIGHLVGVK